MQLTYLERPYIIPRMAATGISEVRPTHEAILDHVLTRPHGTLSELAAVTGYSVSWLSQIMRSDCFRAAYNARRGAIECTVMSGIGDRLNGLANLGIDKLETMLATTSDPDIIIDSFDKIMHRAGYAPNSTKSVAPQSLTINQQNNISLSREDLAALRGQVIEGSQPSPPALAAVTVSPEAFDVQPALESPRE